MGFWRKWGFTILVWVFFLGSIALDGRYPRVDTVWLIVGFGLSAVLSIAHLIRVSRHIGDENFNVFDRRFAIFHKKGANDDERPTDSIPILLD